MPAAAIAAETSPDTPVLGLASKMRQRSTSRSRQFIIYCPDARLRSAVTGFVERIKESVLASLGMRDEWKAPVIINMEPPVTTAPGRQLSQLRYIVTDEGPKIQLDLILREDRFREARFTQQVVRALLLEMAARQPGALGKDPVDPPGWLVEGLSQQFNARATSLPPNAGLFRQLIETGRLPPLGAFLRSDVELMDSTSLAVFGECCFSLIEMLSAQPGGRKSLGKLAAHLNEEDRRDPVAALLRHFPSLGGREASLEKWWTLGVARFSASDRYLSFSVEETERQLEPLLSLELVTNPAEGTRKKFHLEAYREYLRLPGAQAALLERARELAILQARGHPLMRPVVIEYQRLATQLARKRTRRMDAMLAEIDRYRGVIVERMDNITDYLNWYEATQMGVLSGAFDGYLRAHDILTKEPPPRRYDPITRYLDQVQREFD